MNTYTVVAMAPDVWQGDDRTRSFVEATVASTPGMAANSVRQAFAADIDAEPEDIIIIAVFEGKHSDVYEPVADPGRKET